MEVSSALTASENSTTNTTTTTTTTSNITGQQLITTANEQQQMELDQEEHPQLIVNNKSINLNYNTTSLTSPTSNNNLSQIKNQSITANNNHNNIIQEQANKVQVINQSGVVVTNIASITSTATNTTTTTSTITANTNELADSNTNDNTNGTKATTTTVTETILGQDIDCNHANKELTDLDEVACNHETVEPEIRDTVNKLIADVDSDLEQCQQVEEQKAEVKMEKDISTSSSEANSISVKSIQNEDATKEQDSADQEVESLVAKETSDEEPAKSSTSADLPSPDDTSCDLVMAVDTPEPKNKDMVTLRNLEITPPPPPEPDSTAGSSSKTNDSKESNGSETLNSTSTSKRSTRRKRTASSSAPTPDLNESGETGRSKRQRTQTKLFQVGAEPTKSDESIISVSSTSSKTARTTSRSSSARSSRRKSTASSTTPPEINTTAQDSDTQHCNDQQYVIHYEKNDYLAIRNEDDSFYLCQLAETVRVKKSMVKVKWLDTKSGENIYYLTNHYDKVPQKSIIMPVTLKKLKSEKKNEQLFELEEQDHHNILDRLKRSLNATEAAASSSQESVSTIEA